MKKILLLASIILLAALSPIRAQDKAAEIDKLMSLYTEYGQFNGSVLVAEKGVVIHKKGYGLANMEWAIPNAADTKHRLGSITKQFTSMLIMQLVEEGKIDLQESMTTYLPDYRKETGKQISIFHLLTHTSGIPSYTSRPDFSSEISRNSYEVDEFVEKFCSGDLQFEPGSTFRYNNSGYFLLGAIIEKVSGLSYVEALHARILDPLGMEDTGYDMHAPILEKRAAAYEKEPRGYVNAAYLDMGVPFAAGSMYSTVEDLYKWDQALYTTSLLSDKGKDLMFTPFLKNYACGWSVGNRTLDAGGDSLMVISHGGGINGFNTLITRYVDNRHLIVLLNNTGHASLGEMTNGITNILFGKPYDLPQKEIPKE